MRFGKARTVTVYECVLVKENGREIHWDFPNRKLGKAAIREGWALKPGTGFKKVTRQTVPVFL